MFHGIGDNRVLQNPIHTPQKHNTGNRILTIQILVNLLIFCPPTCTLFPHTRAPPAAVDSFLFVSFQNHPLLLALPPTLSTRCSFSTTIYFKTRLSSLFPQDIVINRNISIGSFRPQFRLPFLTQGPIGGVALSPRPTQNVAAIRKSRSTHWSSQKKQGLLVSCSSKTAEGLESGPRLRTGWTG